MVSLFASVFLLSVFLSFFYKILSFYFDLSLSQSLFCPAISTRSSGKKYRIFVDFLFQFSAAFIYLLLSFFFTSAVFYHIFPVYFLCPFSGWKTKRGLLLRSFFFFYFSLFLAFPSCCYFSLLFKSYLSVCMCELSVCVNVYVALDKPLKIPRWDYFWERIGIY